MVQDTSPSPTRTFRPSLLISRLAGAVAVNLRKIRTESQIEEYVAEIDSTDKEAAATYLLLSDDRLPFDLYDGELVDGLVALLSKLRNNFIRCEELLKSSIKRHFVDGAALHQGDISRLSSSVMLSMMYDHIRLECDEERMNDIDYDSLINRWRDEIFNGLRVQRQRLAEREAAERQMLAERAAAERQMLAEREADRLAWNVGMTPEQRLNMNKEFALASQLKDGDFISKMSALLKEGKGTEGLKDIFPFMFVCGPSGTGKTTLAWNLQATLKSPILYWHYKEIDQWTAQQKYRPYQNISYTIKSAIVRDIELWGLHSKKPKETKNVSTKGLDNADIKKIEFESVHLIVDLFRQLHDAKKAQPESSWAEAQCKIEKVRNGKMSIDEGKKALKNLTIGDFPLTTFIDEASVAGADSTDANLSDRVTLVFTSSMLRILNILPIFGGTEARASNFCGPHTSTSRGSAIGYWVCVFNDLPPFKLSKLIEHCKRLREKFKGRPGVLKIVDFLEHTSRNENPWLVSLAIEYLDVLPETTDSASDLQVLDAMLNYVFTKFITQKKNEDLFNSGQLNYIFGYTWKDGTCLVNKGSEDSINGHLALLLAFSYGPNEPFFKLTTEKGPPKYFGVKKHVNIDFVPKCYFRHFTDAPLTGLVLFGLNLNSEYQASFPSEHTPLVRYADSLLATRSTVFDAIYYKCDRIPVKDVSTMMQRNSDGSRLEFLYHVAALIASRANGVTGCPFSIFLDQLIREFSSSSDPVTTTFTCPPHFASKIIPVIAPMETPAWPKAVRKLLEGLTTQHVNLGTMETSIGTEPVDSVICKLHPAIEEYEYSDDEQSLPKDISQEGSDEAHDLVTKIARLEIESLAEKKYGYRDHVDVDVEGVEEICICECKQLAKPMTLSQIRNDVVKKKFLGNYPDCGLNILLTLSITKSRDDMKAAKALNAEDGYFMWHLEKASDGGHLEIAPYDDQEPWNETYKDVIVIPMNVIWSEETFKKVIAAWNVKLDEQ